MATLRLFWVLGASFAGDVAAADLGYWRDEGLSVTINEGGFDVDPIRLVAGGAEDFGVTNSSQFLFARQAGVPVVAIGAVLQRSPIGWAALADSGIQTPDDFRGKRVGQQFGTGTETLLYALLGKLGIPRKELTEVPMKFDYQPFLTGSVDVAPVYLTDQPITFRRQGYDVATIDPFDYGVTLYYATLYFTSESMIRDNPALVARFMRGAMRGWSWVLRNPAKAAEALAARRGDLDAEIEAERLTLQNELTESSASGFSLGLMTRERWQQNIDLLSRYADLDPGLKIDDGFTNRFVSDSHE